MVRPRSSPAASCPPRTPPTAAVPSACRPPPAGVVGFKPSAPRLAAQGFITRSLIDAAFLLHITPVAGRRRIGVLTRPLFAGATVEEAHLRGVAEAAERLRAAGHDVVEVHPYPDTEITFESFRTIFTAKLAGLPGPAEGLVAWLRAHGRAVTRTRLDQANRHADHLGRHLAEYWDVDALLTPMTTTDPPPLGYFAARPGGQLPRADPLVSVGIPVQHDRFRGRSVPWSCPDARPSACTSARCD